MILSIETSTKAFSVYVEEETLNANLEIVFSLTHSQSIVQTVDFIIKRIGKEVKDIKEIYVGLGPGSFTGIRVGLSFVNTLLQVLDVPIVGASSLDTLSFEIDKWKSPIIPFIRSRKDEVYTSFYKENKRVDNFKVLKIDDFLDYIYKNKPKYLVSSEDDYLAIIKPLFNNEVIDKDISFINSTKVIYSYPKAKYIPAIVKNEGRHPDKKYLKPMYIRNF